MYNQEGNGWGNAGSSCGREQQRSAQDSELSFAAQLKQVKSAQSSEAAGNATSQAQTAEAAAQLAEQGLATAQAVLHKSNAN